MCEYGVAIFGNTIIPAYQCRVSNLANAGQDAPPTDKKDEFTETSNAQNFKRHGLSNYTTQRHQRSRRFQRDSIAKSAQSGYNTSTSSPLESLLLPTSPQMCRAPRCGREILFPINIEAGMPLPQWGRLVDSFNHNSPRLWVIVS